MSLARFIAKARLALIKLYSNSVRAEALTFLRSLAVAIFRRALAFLDSLIQSIELLLLIELGFHRWPDSNLDLDLLRLTYQNRSLEE